MDRSSLVIVSPALASANNGNWQTARRWRALLARDHAVRITAQWPDAAAAGDDLMLALHARRSASSIRAWAEARGGRRLAVVLTGTDLYQDLAEDPLARESTAQAGRLVVLQSLGIEALPEALRAKARVIYQSTSARAALPKTRRELRAVMVGHLRQVKDPGTLFEAARRLRADEGIRIDHIGDAAEAGWAEAARQVAAQCPHYRWLGPRPHARARDAIQRAHLLVHTSALEGGAHVIMEAVRSGTPVLASRVPGNVGMLGEDYLGYFEPRDAAALAERLRQCRREQQAQAQDHAGPLLERLRGQCELRAALFDPARERERLLQLIEEMQQS
ncbi:selenoneine biosynthesis selenosugar synthase SenB [Ramlibacter rhizophilus]|uniref:TIGR04348 family glycosyltransferase n=1 Tax=Ramlibacter rhizophilus TaxID=1781167 RepID=A0A4Z0BP75_9BURK|nr:selenoneine biosynthesis selenosugar synthase SenB [Ramlibacter rhizophilus]TFZ01116.1 TIGR04348 family glycosyltransferase [Ramlibacter rhizophilus]